MLGAGWSSLEVVKLLVAVATPIAVVVLGLYVKRAGQRIEDAQWSSRKFVERRLELYDEMAPMLNDLYCFFLCVGDFRSITPPCLIVLKRKLDKTFHVNRFLFGQDFVQNYDALMALCFKTWQESGTAARIRASIDHQRSERGASAWDDAWAAMLLDPSEEAPGLRGIADGYSSLMESFAREVGVGAEPAASRMT